MTTTRSGPSPSDSARALWHGDKSTLRLRADVLDTRRVGPARRSATAPTPAPGDGTVVVIGGGTAHGSRPWRTAAARSTSPARRLALVEPPHMHVSMCFVPDGDPCPTTGEWVDVNDR